VRKLALALLIASACRSGPQTGGTAAAEDAKVYYPLAVGNSWTYALRGADRQETIQIVGRDGPWFIDDHRGRLRYENDGVRDADRYLLRTPLAAGEKWTAVENLVVQRFEVMTMEGSAVTRAGTFTHCAVVRNEQPLGKKGKFVTEWTYARGVGMVQLVTSTVDAQGKQQEQTRLQLVAYRVGQ
jgi:hypothetical protein